jgi:hypothetical protein
MAYRVMACVSGPHRFRAKQMRLFSNGCARVTLVLFRRRARGELSGAEQRIGARVRKSRQKEAAGAADAGLMQIEWSEGEVLKG